MELTALPRPSSWFKGPTSKETRGQGIGYAENGRIWEEKGKEGNRRVGKQSRNILHQLLPTTVEAEQCLKRYNRKNERLMDNFAMKRLAQRSDGIEYPDN